MNPNNCAACDHKARPDGGWCYMFREEPQATCAKHTARTTGAMPDRAGSVQGNPPPPEMWRQLGENRAAHRARLKRARTKTPNG